MAALAPYELRRFNRDPVRGVDYTLDIDYRGDGTRGHRLDVLAPCERDAPLPVYLYFHGGGWTSGDKAPLTKYCASQARSGMVVVNANYRTVGPVHMTHVLHDANAALRWVRQHIASYGGDPDRIVLGGDSAGGQIAALVAAATTRPELAAHYRLRPAAPRTSIRGLVLHCSAVDFSVIFEPGFVMGLGFVRMLLPGRGKGLSLRRAARWLSPIEWLDASFTPVLVTTSERDFFYRANLNFVAALRGHGVHVDTLVFDRSAKRTEHTWQQDARHAESQQVYRLLQDFVRRMTRVAVPA